MADLNEKLPPIMRERLAKIGEESPEEKEKREDSEELDSLLAEFYRNSLDSKGLFQRLKEYEDHDKQFLLKEAKIKLESSFKRKGLPIKFRERNDGKFGQLVAQKIGALPREMLEPELIKHLEESKEAA